MSQVSFCTCSVNFCWSFYHHGVIYDVTFEKENIFFKKLITNSYKNPAQFYYAWDFLNINFYHTTYLRRHQFNNWNQLFEKLIFCHNDVIKSLSKTYFSKYLKNLFSLFSELSGNSNFQKLVKSLTILKELRNCQR